MLNAARQKYLVLTALEDYWDTNKPLVFLGDWCCRFGRRAAWDKPINEIISHPFKVKGEHARTFEYVSAVYEKFLVELAVKLNTIHSTSHNVRYWRIIIGPWLLCYIGAMYERYRLLKKVLIEHPGIITVLLPKDDRETPLDTRSFFSGMVRY